MQPQLPPNMGSQPQQPGGGPPNQQQRPRRAGVGEILGEDAPDAQPPSAPPPLQDMDRIPGYQDAVNPNVNHIPPPPSYAEAARNTNRPPEQFSQIGHITEQEARECLTQYVKSKCCWGKSAVESMTFTNLQSTTAVHYILSSFHETRSTDWVSEPYHGQRIDGLMGGTAPHPWALPIQTPPPFADQVVHCEVPHTASVKTCHRCRGTCYVDCYSCRGHGLKNCGSCGGRGYGYAHQDYRTCYRCYGSGLVDCSYCRGLGEVRCDTCNASGRLKYFIRMTVTFQTHTSDFILERTPLPDELIRDVAGTTLYEDTQQRVLPIQTFPEPDVNRQSQVLINQHSQLTQSGRILMQTHVIRGVPVFQCDCVYSKKPFQYFIYGYDRLVYATGYPQKCCCQIL